MRAAAEISFPYETLVCLQIPGQWLVRRPHSEWRRDQGEDVVQEVSGNPQAASVAAETAASWTAEDPAVPVQIVDAAKRVAEVAPLYQTLAAQVRV